MTASNELNAFSSEAAGNSYAPTDIAISSGFSRRSLSTVTACLFVTFFGCTTQEEVDPVSVPGAPVEIERPAKLSIGEVEGADEEQLHQVRAPSLLPDGSVLVPLGSPEEIRIFDSDGDLRRRYGGPGEGPGEFRGLSSAWARGDTVEAWDSRLARITRFRPDGEIETVHLQYDADHWILSSVVGVASEGWLLNSTVATSLVEGERDSLVVYHFGRDGRQVGDEIARTAGMDRGRLSSNRTGPLPLSPAAKFSFRSDREGERLYVAETLAPRIEIFDLSGTSVGTVAWEPEQSWDPDHAFERAGRVAEEGRELPFRGAIQYDPEWVRTTSPPDNVPVFSDFAVDEKGFVWVRPYDPERDAVALGGSPGDGRTGPGGEWRVFSPEGEEVGRVEVPDGLLLHQISSDAVVGVYRDELGVEFVRVYSLKRY